MMYPDRSGEIYLLFFGCYFLFFGLVVDLLFRSGGMQDKSPETTGKTNNESNSRALRDGYCMQNNLLDFYFRS